MKGKTLTVTITPETAIGCIDALVNVAKVDLRNRSLELLVALSLEGFIGQLRTNGHILPLTEEDAIRRIAIYEAGLERQRLPSFEDIDLEFNREQTGLPAADLETPDYNTIERAADKMKNQGVERTLEVNESPEPREQTSVNTRQALLHMERDQLVDIQMGADKDDELVKQAEHEGGDMQVAVELVYSKAPRALWNTEKAKELVYKVLEELHGD